MVYTPASIVEKPALASGLTVLHDEILSSAGTFDVQNIPQGYKHLLVLGSLRGTKSDTFDLVSLRLNNDSSSNYRGQNLYGVNITAAAGDLAAATSFEIAGVPAATAPSEYFGGFEMKMFDYAGTLNRKVVHAVSSRLMSESAGNNALVAATGFWDSTAAVNRVTIYPVTGNFLAGSRLTIYGLGGTPVTTKTIGTELAYAEVTSSLNVTATTAASAQTFLTASAVTFDGLTRICIESFICGALAGTSAGSTLTVSLWDGATNVGIVAVHGRGTGTTGNPYNPHYTRTYLTPSAGSHTYTIRAHRGTSDATLHASDGGDDDFMPAYIRITIV